MANCKRRDAATLALNEGLQPRTEAGPRQLQRVVRPRRQLPIPASKTVSTCVAASSAKYSLPHPPTRMANSPVTSDWVLALISGGSQLARVGAAPIIELMARSLPLILFLTLAYGVFAQEPAANDARIAEAVGMLDAGRYHEVFTFLVPGGDPDEVRAVAKRYVSANPGQASGHLLVGRIFETQGFRVPALYSYMRFLALEPSSPRSAGVATRLQNLIATIRVSKQNTLEGTISFASGSRKEEGDLTDVENIVWVVSHQIETDSPLLNPFHGRGGTDFEKAVYVLSELILTEQVSKKPRSEMPNFTFTVHRPFFMAMEKQNLVAPYAGLALSSLGLSGTEDWMKKNAKKVDRYRAWMQSQMGNPEAAGRKK